MKKGKFFILDFEKNRGNANPKADERDGYIDTIKGIEIGFHANREGKKVIGWTATELTTGFGVGTGKTRKAAAEFVNNNIDYLKAKLKDTGLDKYRDIIKKANAKVEGVPEFTEIPTKAEPKPITETCYAKTEETTTNVGKVIKAKAPVHPKSLFKEKDRNKRVKEMTKKLEDGVADIFTSGKYEKYLSAMSKFRNYSLNNTLLIAMQMPTATLVAGYENWQKNFNRHVRRGEKAIQIIGGFNQKKTIVNEKGEEEEVSRMWYKPVSVYDISQTDGEDLPTLCTSIKGDVEGYENLVQKLRKVSPVKIEFEDINNGSNGYYHIKDKRIAIKSGMSQAHTVKTMVHEIAHSILHDRDNGNEKDADGRTREVQAESVAYVVNQYLGLDTSDYSFGYIAGWGKGKEMKELKASLEIIRKTAYDIIKEIEGGK